MFGVRVLFVYELFVYESVCLRERVYESGLFTRVLFVYESCLFMRALFVYECLRELGYERCLFTSVWLRELFVYD